LAQRADYDPEWVRQFLEEARHPDAENFYEECKTILQPSPRKNGHHQYPIAHLQQNDLPDGLDKLPSNITWLQLGKLTKHKLRQTLSFFPNRRFLILLILSVFLLIGMISVQKSKESQPMLGLFSRGWILHINKVDDRAIVLLNGEVIHYNQYLGGDQQEILYLDEYLTETENHLTLITLNGPSRTFWDYELFHNGRKRWDNKNHIDDPYSMPYAVNLTLGAETVLEESTPHRGIESITEPVSVTLQGKEAIVVLVDDIPVTGAFNSPSKSSPYYHAFNLSPFLEQGESHQVEILTWANTGFYHWDISIAGEQNRWQCIGNGTSERPSTVFREKFTIAASGQVQFRDDSCFLQNQFSGEDSR
jgi:hypothetical protein